MSSNPRVSKSLQVDSILARQNDGIPVLPVLGSAPSKGLIAYDTATNGTTGWPFIADGTAWRPVLLSVSSLAGTGLSLSIGPVPVLSIAPTGVTPGVYGSSTMVPQITVNAQGQITSIVNVPISSPLVGCQVRAGAGDLQIFVAPMTGNVFAYGRTDLVGYTLALQPFFTNNAGIFTCTSAGVYDITSNIMGEALFGVGPYTFVAKLLHNVSTLAETWTYWAAGTNGAVLSTTTRLAVGDTIGTTITYAVAGSQYQVYANTSLLAMRIGN